MSDEYKEDIFENTSISKEELEKDVEKLDELDDRLDELKENADNLSPREQAQAIVETILKAVHILEKYNKPGHEALLEELVSSTYMDEDSLNEALEKYKAIGNAIDVYDDQHDQEIDELKALYDRTLNMDGLSNEEKMERYETFLSAYKKLMLPLAGREDSDLIQDHVHTRAGIHPDGFIDKGAEYIELHAIEFKELVDQAESYTRDDALKELKADGIENPTPTQIEEHYLDQKLALYKEAENYYDKVKANIFIEDPDMPYFENLAGLSIDWLIQQIDIVKIEQEILKNSPEYANEQALNTTTQDPQNNRLAVNSEIGHNNTSLLQPT